MMKIKVYRNQYGWATLARNNDDKMYISVQFKKGFEPDGDRATIIIEDAFFSMYKNNVGLAFPKLVIMSYTLDQEETYIDEERVAIQEADNISSDDLPF